LGLGLGWGYAAAIRRGGGFIFRDAIFNHADDK
jgi:hypothetical protein